jgi:putative DNA primase/helicase
MRAEQLAKALGATRSGRQWKCRCVAHEDGSPSMIFFDGREEGRVQVRCMAGCEPADIIYALKSRGLWDTDRAIMKESTKTRERQPSPQEIQDKKREHAMRVLARGIFDEAGPIRGSIAERYFESRDVADVARMIDDIRYHPSCPRFSGRQHTRQPAVVAAMRSIETNAMVAIQRIFLTRQGKKDGKGMMLGPAGGAAMKLQCLQNSELHICEGLETGLSVIAMDQGPVWALGSSGAIQTFGVIETVNRLTIWADNDEAGLKAAEQCETRWRVARRTVETFKPRKGGRDFNDVWSARCARF